MFVPGAYYVKNELPAHPLSDEELDLLLLCDGEHDISDSGKLFELLSKNLIEPCEKGQHPSEWSAYKSYPHRHFPKMNFMITGRCNCNCLHCFNAKDNHPVVTGWEYEDALDLIRQAADCGIMAFTITGGEPMLHPHFMDILKAIHANGMFVEEINTNGHFITQDFLDELRSFDCDPLMKISYDGVNGWHNWIRNNDASGKMALNAIELCLKNDFRVKVQTQVNNKNFDSLLDTALMLNEMGVENIRMIRTTEAPRWAKMAGDDACISVEDYYEKIPRLARKIYDSINALDEDKRHLKEMVFWQFLNLHLQDASYDLYPIRYKKGDYRDTHAVCPDNRGMIGVGSNGELYPCIQMSGYHIENDIHLANLKEKPLSEYLESGRYLSLITQNLYQLRQKDNRCHDCRFYEYCCGGCRALALLFSRETEGYNSEDPTKCLFFNKGWYAHTVKCMGDLENLRPLPDELVTES